MNEEHVERIRPTTKERRPTGLTIIAIVWLLAGMMNLYGSAQRIRSDLVVLWYLPLLDTPEWFKIGVPAEIAISFLAFALGLVQMYTIYGLLTGKSWSYKLALIVPVLGAASWVAVAGLYVSAPLELGMRKYVDWGGVSSSIVWIFAYWGYLRQPHVKEYLGQGKPVEMKRQANRKVSYVIVALIPLVLQTVGSYLTPHSASPISPTGYETYSKHGFSFKYPNGMVIEEEPVDNATTDNSGMVLVELQNEKHELFYVAWVRSERALNLEMTLEDVFRSMERQELVRSFEKGELVETKQMGHRMLYQHCNVTFVLGGGRYAIYGVWYCNASQTNFLVTLMSGEENIPEIFNTYLDSFVCHER